MEWIIANWDICLAGFVLAEKIVKLTPTKHDDIIIDIIGRAILRRPKK